jgi:hypothetical protein
MLGWVLLKVNEVLFIGEVRWFGTGRGDKLLRTAHGVLLGSGSLCLCQCRMEGRTR